jgi:hypothetical protein
LDYRRLPRAVVAVATDSARLVQAGASDGATLLGSPDNHRIDPIGSPDNQLIDITLIVGLIFPPDKVSKTVNSAGGQIIGATVKMKSPDAHEQTFGAE